MRLFIPFLAGIICYFSFDYFPILVSVCLIVSSVYMFKRKKIFVVMVLMSSFLFALSRQLPAIDPFECDNAVIEGRISEMPVKTDFGYANNMKVSEIRRCSSVVKGKMIRVFSSESLSAGSDVILLADIKGRYRYRNPGSLRNSVSIAASVKKVYHLENNRKMTWFIHRQRERVIECINTTFSGTTAAFISAIVTGHKRDLPDEVKKGFASAGLSHLLAISGAHFGVFSFLIFSCFRFIVRRLPCRFLSRITLHVTPSELAAIFTFPFMIFYLFLSGTGIPAVRSFIMINVFLFGLLLGRRRAWKNAVAFAAFVLLVISPNALLDISFVLSFTAVIFIGYVLQWKREDDQDVLTIDLSGNISQTLKRWIEVTFIVSIAAYIGTLPIVLYFFHTISFISPLTNVVIAPVVCFLIIPLAVLGTLSWLVTGFFPFAFILQLLSDNILALIDFISDLSFIRMNVPAFPIIFVVFFYGGITMIIGRRKAPGVALTFLCAVLMFAFPLLKEKSDLEITFLDVGQAESSVVTLPDRRIMVIDTGKNGKQTVGYLDYLGVNKVDLLVLSHAGRDHAGGYTYTSRMKEVNLLVDNGRIVYPQDVLSGIDHRPLQRGDVISGEGYRIEILHPYEKFYSLFSSHASAENNDSLVLRIDVDGRRFLFTGDIEREAEDNIVMVGDHLKSDVIKVAHHGSRTSSSKEFIALVDPSIAVVSAGMFNPYGHPHRIAMAHLGDVSALNTATVGAIKISLRGSGESEDTYLDIKTFEEFRLKSTERLRDETANIQKLFSTW
jgi:competence protein ComEC